MKPSLCILPLLLPALTVLGSTLSAEDELLISNKTVHVYETQDLEEAVDSKHNISVILHNNISVTESSPHFDSLLNDSPCWESDALFNLSNYVFTSSMSYPIFDLTFSASDGTEVGKVVRNGRAEFYQLGNLTFSNIHNTEADVTGSYTPITPYSTDGTDDVQGSSDILAEYGYGGVFSSAADLVNGVEGGVYIHDCYGSVTFSNITYDAGSMGDVDCDLVLMGGAIYVDEEWNAVISDNCMSGGTITFSNVSLTLDRSTEYANSSICRFHAYGGAIYTKDLAMENNWGSVVFRDTGIQQTAVYHDQGEGYGGALWLKGTGNSISGNYAGLTFENCTVSVANTAEGGAIYLSSGASLDISHNAGDVSFISNSARASAIDGWMDGGDDALALGGAIYVGDNATLNITENAYDGSSVIFDSNSVSASATESGASVSNAGGAIYGGSGSNINIEGNYSVSFTGNTADRGSAIYTEGSLSIRNNEEVLFSGNSGTYAVYMSDASSVLHLSAAEGKEIVFKDGLYSAGSAVINAAYGEIRQNGSVELSAATAVVDGGTTISDGSLKLLQGSTLQSNTVVEAAAALTAKGVGNTIDGNLSIKDGGTLSILITQDNTESAVLNISGEFGYESNYTLNSNFVGKPTDGQTYVLLQLSQSAPYNSAYWNTDTVTVTGDVGFEDLEWINDNTTLVYTYHAVTPAAGDLIWMKSASTDNWNFIAKNWVTAEAPDTPVRFTTGSRVFFTDACTDESDVVIRADVDPTSITVNAERDYVFADGGGKITGETSLVKTGSGCLTIELANDFSGGVDLQEGSLFIKNSSAMGTGNVNVAQGATLIIDKSTDIEPPAEGSNTSVDGNLQIGSGSIFAFMDGDVLHAESVEVNGMLIINPGAAKNGAGAQKLSGTGSVNVAYANSGESQKISFAENAGYTGNIILSSQDNSFVIESGGYNGNGTLQIEEKGNSVLDFNGGTVTLQSGGRLQSDYGNAVIAGSITMQEGSTLFATAETTPDLTAIDVAGYTGPIQAQILTLEGGSVYHQYGGYYSLAGVDKLVFDGSNGLTFTLNTNLRAVEVPGRETSSRFILFTDVADWEVIGEVDFVITGANADYPLYLVYEGTTLYLDSISTPIPEPSGTTLTLAALAALAARRRRAAR